MHNKDGNDRVDGEPPAPHNPQRYVLEDPPLAHPGCHHGVEREGGGDGRPLEIARLAGGVLGEGGGCDVEAGETDEAAEDEAGEEDGVEVGAEAEGRCDSCGGDAEGDLWSMSAIGPTCIRFTFIRALAYGGQGGAVRHKNSRNIQGPQVSPAPGP